MTSKFEKEIEEVEREKEKVQREIEKSMKGVKPPKIEQIKEETDEIETKMKEM